MAAIQIFLSTVSAEFETYREALERHLTARGRTVSIQEHFAASGTPTLDKLDGYVKTSDVVVHLLGDLAGAMAQPRSVDYLRSTYPDFAARFPLLTAYLMPGGPTLLYTQWEAWLALYHRKPVIVAAPNKHAPRGPRYKPPVQADKDSQKTHRDLLAANECHVEFKFDTIEGLAIELHKALVPLAAGPTKPCDLPPAAGHFVGRVHALKDLATRLREGRSTTVVGAAGLGKTALAAAALRQVVGDTGERLPTSPWPDGVLLLDLYVHRGMADPAWHALANRVKGPDWLPDQSGPVRAAEALRDQRVLIVVEGAEQADGEEGRSALPDLQRPLGTACRWLILTRLLSQADPAERIWLQDRLDDAEADELLDQLVHEGGALALPPTVREPVLALLQGHPLALTWAGKLLARGDEDPHWLLREWQAGTLPPLSDPKESRHTLAWLFDRSVSRLGDDARVVLSVAGCLAPAPVPLAAFAAALPLDESHLRAGLRRLVQHGLLRLSDDRSAWQFAHVLAYAHARDRYPSEDDIPAALADWLWQAFSAQLERAEPSGVAASLEHAGALMKRDLDRLLWAPLWLRILHDARERLENLGWLALEEAALDCVAQALAALPDTVQERLEIQRERSVEGSFRGSLLARRGDLSGAGLAFRMSLAVSERLAKADPSNAQWQSDVGETNNRIGDVLSMQGDLSGAEAAYRATLAVFTRLSEANPSNAHWPRGLSVSYNKMGDVLSAQGDLSGAEAAYRASLVVRERLATADPNNAQRLRDLGLCYMNIGLVLSAQGDLSGAEAAYRASLAVYERLVHARPGSAQWQLDLSWSQYYVGWVLREQGDLSGAAAAYRASLAVRERLAKADPSNAQWQRALAVAYLDIGGVLSALGDLSGAEAAYRAALVVIERLAKADPSNSLLQSDLSGCQDGIGQVLSAKGDLNGAAAAYRASLAVRERLANADQSNAEWQHALARSNWRLGWWHRECGQLREAVRYFTACALLTERLSALDPRNARWRSDVEVIRTTLSEMSS